jgi:glycosyltransferase involved in cell wall biosynthesis
LFRWPGAAERARRGPWRLLSAATFAAGLRLHLRRIAPVHQLVAHWMVPTGWPLLAAVEGPLEVVAHGADVRLLLALPSPMRAAIVHGLVRRDATFRFVADQARDRLLTALPPSVAEPTRQRSRVEPLPLRMPDGPASEAASAAARRWLAGADDRPVVASVARLVESKRVDLAVRAAARHRPAVTLLVVGDGPAQRSLEELARRLGVDARFTGRVPRSVALALMAGCRALIHPSAEEAAPTAVREARALGVPVVACDAGDVVRWARSDPGIVVSAPTPEALAVALARALARRQPLRAKSSQSP